MKKLLLIACLFLSSPAHATDWCVDSANKGCWGMEDATTENDLSANNEDLTVSAGDTIEQSADKKFGSFSRNFERTSEADYLEHADGGSTDISGANQSITYGAWVKLESQTADMAILAKWTAAGSQRAYSVRYDTSDDVFYCTLSIDGVASNTALGATTISDAVWYHVACVYNDTDIRLYVNGDLDSNGASNPFAYTSGIKASSAIFTIGNRDVGGTDLPFDGLIDDAFVFNDAKSEANIEDIMNNGLQSVATRNRVRLIQ